MLCSSSRRWAVRPLTLSHPNHRNKILLFLFSPQRLSFSSSSSSSSRTNIILKSQSESETHINTIIMEDEVSKQRRSMEFLSSKPYVPPQWASHLSPIPSHIFSLANVTNQHKQNKTLPLFYFFIIILDFGIVLNILFLFLSASHSNSQMEPS